MEFINVLSVLPAAAGRGGLGRDELSSPQGLPLAHGTGTSGQSSGF